MRGTSWSETSHTDAIQAWRPPNSTVLLIAVNFLSVLLPETSEPAERFHLLRKQPTRMSDTEPFDVTVVSGITVAAFKSGYSQIDETHVEHVSRKLMDLVSGMTSPALVLDMTHVEFFGSSFIETMFRVWKRLQGQQGAKFALCGLRPYCREVLEVTHLDSLWRLYPTRDEALAGIRSP
jgi:anti-sigma B factor antagonist